MLVSDILKTKSGQVHSVVSSASLATAAGIMATARIGALLVEGPTGEPVGLVSEREATAALARYAGSADRLPVSEVMLLDPATVSPGTAVIAVTHLMTAHRARHVLVAEEGRVVGILSIGDVLKSRLDEKTLENDILHDIARWPRAA